MPPIKPVQITDEPQSPVYVRVSKAVALFGIGRTTLYSLISSKKIKSVLLKSKGSKTGIRLVNFDSLKEYLDNQIEEN